MIEIVEIENGKSEVCEAILRALPQWFGIEASLVAYVADVATLRTWVARDGSAQVGFIAVDRHNTATAEVHVIGVLASHHRHGVGRALVDAAAGEMRRAGCSLLEVKTLGPSHRDEGYRRTRAFYEAMGFLPVEERSELWGPKNPCLIMVKWIGANDPRAT